MLSNIRNILRLKPCSNVISRSNRNISTHNRNSSGAWMLKNLKNYKSSSSSSPTNNNFNNNNIEEVGLYSIKGLNKPNDFLKLASSSIDECNTIRQNLSNKLSSSNIIISNKEDASIILKELDDISNIVCCVIDAAELCRNTHSEIEWRNYAEKVFGMLSSYISELNSDDTLYKILVQVTTSSNYNELSQEEQRFSIVLKNEFERDGIHLSIDKRNDIATIQNHITNCETTFSQNIIQSNNKEISKPLPYKNDILNIVPYHLLPQQDAHDNNNSIQISSDSTITNTILKHSTNPSLRKDVYMHANTTCKQNLDVLNALIHYRNTVANKLGFDSYSHYFLRDKMIKHPDNVNTFLNNINKRVKQYVKKDYEILQTLKKYHEGPESSSNEIHPWDNAFYYSLYKEQKYNLDPNLLSSCFTIQRCLHGMKILVDKLFDIQMEQVQINDKSNDKAWCNNLMKYKFIYQGNDIGLLYLDLYPRDDKFVHAAHFTIQCGCYNSTNPTANSDDSSKVQIPIVALVCNLSSSTTISHSEVETLFHEFGHVLHSLLSKTQFQHLSGTRTCVDFVETPSLLLENFVWDANFLSLLSNHSIDIDVLKNQFIPSRNALKYLDIQTQCLYARFDQIIFGPNSSIWDPNSTNNATTQIFESLHRENSMPFANGTHWHTRFGHLVSYGRLLL